MSMCNAFKRSNNVCFPYDILSLHKSETSKPTVISNGSIPPHKWVHAYTLTLPLLMAAVSESSFCSVTNLSAPIKDKNVSGFHNTLKNKEEKTIIYRYRVKFEANWENSNSLPNLIWSPLCNHWGHQFIYKRLLLLIVFELVTDENQSFHQGAFLHVSERDSARKQFLHMIVKHLKTRL